MTEGKPRIERHWVFDWRLLVFSGFFLPLLLALGFWQLDRAADKQALLADWSDAGAAPAWEELAAGELIPGQPVRLRGRFSEYTWLLDNRTRDGQAGYEVLTLFTPEQGPPVVINRGWVAAPRQRGELPAITDPDGPVALTARVSDYPRPPVLGDSEPEQNWPRRVQQLSPAMVRELAPTVPARTLKLAGSNQPGAFRADWEPDIMGPQTHYGYAVQWFGLALALVILTIVASYRKQER